MAKGTARGDVSVRRAQDRVRLPDLTCLHWYLAREVVDEIVRCGGSVRRGFVMRWKTVAMRAHNVGRRASSRCGRAAESERVAIGGELYQLCVGGRV